MSFLLDGRSLADTLRQELAAKIAELKITPCLGVILVGDDPASHLYVKLKEQAAAEVGIRVDKILLSANCTEDQVLDKLKIFNQRPDVQAILVQLPLPPQLNENLIISQLDPAKDADGFHPQNLQRLQAGETVTVPGVCLGIMKLIDLAAKDTAGGSAVLLVNSPEFAQPLAELLGKKNIKSQIIYQPDRTLLRAANIIIVAKGQPNLITADDIQDGAIVIDVGTNKVGSRLVGDVDADSLKQRPVYLTPVPGGVGPMTVAMLLWNVYQLALINSHR